MWSNRSAIQTLSNGTSFLSLVSRLEREAPEEQELHRRRCPRWAFKVPAVLIYQAGGDKPAVSLCRVRDLGKKGIGLVCNESVPRNVVAEVFVFCSGVHYKAKVLIVRCDPHGLSYMVGCEFQEG
jgi:hypothetical protein